MSLDIYLAVDNGRTILHAEAWADRSTLGILKVLCTPNIITIKALKLALQTTPRTVYHSRLTLLAFS